MSDLTASHPDEFTLLRLIAGDLPVGERRQTEDHLQGCGACSGRMSDLAELDSMLRSAAEDGALEDEPDAPDLPREDAFHARPDCAAAATRTRPASLALAVEAARDAASRQREILASASDPRALAALLSTLSLDGARDRFALLYALQEAGPRIAESPVRTLRLAEAALERLRRDAAEQRSGDADAVVPRLAIVAQAHTLAGQACNWTSEFLRAGSHLRIAYRSFSEIGDEIGLATVEHLESQRRFFLERPQEALTLALRARRTFHALGLEDMRARSSVAVGIALYRLGGHEKALRIFREAAAVFEKRALWSNYINCLNNIGACLQQTGRLDEARQEYARALRRFPRNEARSLAFLRHGLAEVLFCAGRYREAALSVSRAVRLYAGLNLSARALTASLLEIESWARSGDLARARHRLEIFQIEVRRHGGLDPAITAEIERALSGAHPDFARVAELRRQAQAQFERLFREASA